MNDENQDILQNLEFAMVNAWRKNRDVTDFVVARAYETAYEHYRAEARGHVPKPVELTGLEQEAFEAVQAICEWRRGRGPSPGKDDEPISAVPIEELVECLRELRKSVERHGRTGGKQGYLKFIETYLP